MIARSGGGSMQHQNLPRMGLLYWLLIPLLLMGVSYWIQLNWWGECEPTSSRTIPPQRHLYHILLALLAGWLAWRIPTERWELVGRWGPWVGVLLMVLVVLFGREVNGAVRAFSMMGLSVAPATILPLLFTIVLAHTLPQRYLQQELPLPLMSTVLLSTLLLLTLLQPNGVLLIVTLLTVSAQLLLSGYRWWAVALVAGVVAFVLFRIELPPLDHYQTQMALLSIQNGGWFGSDPVISTTYLPVAQSDLFFAAMTEQIGMVGVAVVIALFSFFLWRVAMVAIRCMERGDVVKGLLAWGIMFHWALQLLLHLGINSGLLPVVGVVLPFMSLGGMHLLLSAIAVGIITRIVTDEF